MSDLERAGADLLAATQDLELSIRDGLPAAVERAVVRRNAAFNRFVGACETARLDAEGTRAREVAGRVLAVDARILELVSRAREAIRQEIEAVVSLRRAQEKARGSEATARFVSRRA